MRVRPRFALSCAAALVVCGAALSAAAPPVPVRITELNVQRDPNYRGGEPEIAVNPRNRNNMVMVWAAMKQVKEPLSGQNYPGLLAEFGSPLTGMQTIQCQMAYTFDGGRTWYPAPFPLRDKPACGDPMVVADSRGTFQISFDLMGTPLTPSTVGTQPTDQVASSSSTDGGRSWSQPLDVGTIVDRPFFRIDPATDELYEVSGALMTASTRKLTRSRDQGRTWSPATVFPSDHLAVNRGILATTVQTGNPSVLSFAVSHDDGATFTTSPVTGATAGGTGDWVAADPTRPGHFAVMQQVGNALQVLRTGDGGVSWSTPLALSVPDSTVSLPWLDYGPDGDLAAVWKAGNAGAATFLLHGALLPAGKDRFSAPLQISGAPSPTGNILTEGAGDDLSWVTVDRGVVLAGWGDRRSGILQAWFARVPFQAFR